MNWLEVLLIAVWVALASILAGLRLAADSRRRTAGGGWWALAWTLCLFRTRRRDPGGETAETQPWPVDGKSRGTVRPTPQVRPADQPTLY